MILPGESSAGAGWDFGRSEFAVGLEFGVWNWGSGFRARNFLDMAG